MGNSGLGISVGNGHFLAVNGVAAYGSVHRSLRLPEPAADHSTVFSCKAVLLYLLRQSPVGGVRLCDYEQTAGVLVYAVDYSGTDNSVYGRKPVAAVIHERIYQRSRVISRSRVDYHALGLVYHQQIIVLFYQPVIISGAMHLLRPTSAIGNFTAIYRIFQNPADQRRIE